MDNIYHCRSISTSPSFVESRRSINIMYHVAFSGSRKGGTPEQSFAFEHELTFLQMKYARLVFHHGDCEGWDEKAHRFASTRCYEIHIHPPINSSARAFCWAGTRAAARYPKPVTVNVPGYGKVDLYIYPEKDYLPRNHDIVDVSEILLACPNEKKERLRSGTWATVRYARKQGKPVVLIFPDGSVRKEGIG